MPNSSNLYSYSAYYANSATVSVVQSVDTNTQVIAGGIARNALTEVTLFAPYAGNPSWKISSTQVGNTPNAPFLWNNNGYFNSATAVFDGIVFFTGSADMTGSIMVYGFN